MKGLRTILIGAVLAILPPLTEYVGAIDWDAVVGPSFGFAVGGVVMIAMRFITNTAVGQKE